MKGLRFIGWLLLVISAVGFSLATHSTDLGATSNHRPILEIYLRDAAALGKSVSLTDSTLTDSFRDSFPHSAVQNSENEYVFYFQPMDNIPNGDYSLAAYFRLDGVTSTDPEVLVFRVNDGSNCGNDVCQPGESCEGSVGNQGLCPTGSIPQGGLCTNCNYIPPPTNCGNSVCDPGENNQNCPQDCPGNNLCGNSVCEPSENAQTCPEDCPAEVCGNGRCDTNENNINCPQDCPKPPTCPNSVCDLGENNQNCVQDCPPPATCPNGICDPSENIQNCVQDCRANVCGNNRCETGENSGNCPNDCPITCPNENCDVSLGETTSTCPQDCPCPSSVKTCSANATRMDNALGQDGCLLPNTCCGDGKCEGLESSENCQPDCKETCAQLGGDACTSTEACTGILLDAQDVQRCCSVACIPKAGDTCSDCGKGLFNLCDRLECYSMLQTCLFRDTTPANCLSCSQFNGCPDYKDDQGCLDNHCGFPSCEWTGVACIRSGSCSDGIKNGQETDIDCGGVCPAKCSTNEKCDTGADCLSGLCVNSTCKNPTCAANDGCVVNCLPHDLDCPPVPNCSEDGNCVLGCPVRDPDCLPASCSNSAKDGQESDVDCGGNCVKCDLGEKCLKNSDCSSDLCENGICKENAIPSCNDLVKNGDETDVDCGGILCDKCNPPKKCIVDNDCTSNLCFNSKCFPIPTCSGGDACKVNCLPPDPDCPPKPSCLEDEMCVLSCPIIDPDCPKTSCTNGFRDGDETGVDCGGSCPSCQRSPLSLEIVTKKHDFSALNRLSAGLLTLVVQAETNNVAFCSLSEEQTIRVDETKLFTGESSTVLRTFHEGKTEVQINDLFNLFPVMIDGQNVLLKTLFVTCKDDFGQVSQVSIDVMVPNFDAFLRVPSLGVASSSPFKVVIETTWPMFCTHSQIPLSGVSAGALFNDGPLNSLKFNHTLDNRSIAGNLFIACKTSTSSEGELFKTFNVNVDTSAPVIQAAFNPNRVTDRGAKFSDLRVQTDDPTVCTMDNGTVTNIGLFDEADPSTYKNDRSVRFDFRAIFDSELHTFNVNTICKNLAGLSSSSTATVTVELDDTLDIIPISPPAFTNTEPIHLKVETTKLAGCSFQGASRSGGMSTSDQKQHSFQFNGLNDGTYTFVATCRATASPDRTASISTTLDRVAPAIDNVIVESPSCDTSAIEFEIEGNSSDATSFKVSLLDQDRVVVNTTRTEKSVRIGATLDAGKMYTLKVEPVDRSGNIGFEIIREVEVLAASDVACDNVRPKGNLEVQPLPQRAAKKAVVGCQDGESGCTLDFLRGDVERDGNCIPNLIEFYGTDIEVSQTQKFCYQVFDNNNNSFTEARVIDVVIPESCTNGFQDLNELGVDCGLGCPQGCPEGSQCTLNSDCLSRYCEAGICKAPSCTDGAKNGNEIDTDCGGDCPKCEEGKKCIDGGDCASGYCTPDRFCRVPSCADGYRNGQESDKDCGGNCPPCQAGKSCANNNDCQSRFCEGGVCVQDKNKDTDKDKMPDWWEIKYNLNINDPTDANQDADADGFTNLQEYLAGTNPRDSKSHPVNKMPLGPFLTLLFGLLLIVGGAGYLIYENSMPGPKAPPKPLPPKPTSAPIPPPHPLQANILRRDLGRRLERERLFSRFSSGMPVTRPAPIARVAPKPAPVKPAPKPQPKSTSAPSKAKPKKKKNLLDKDLRALKKLSRF